MKPTNEELQAVIVDRCVPSRLADVARQLALEELQRRKAVNVEFDVWCRAAHRNIRKYQAVLTEGKALEDLVAPVKGARHIGRVKALNKRQAVREAIKAVGTEGL